MENAQVEEMGAVVEAVRRGRSVLCLGGELTSDGSLRRLVGKLLDRLPDSAEARAFIEARPLMVADHVRRRLGEGFGDALLSTVASTEIAEPLALLGSLPFSAVVTTAYDSAVERAFRRGGVVPPVCTPFDEAPPRGRARFVFKLLGDPARPGTVVWGAADLQGALGRGGYRLVSEELFPRRSFLFLGFDRADAELHVLLERILSSAGVGAVEHFAVLPGLARLEREELWAVYRLRVLDADDAGDFARTLHLAMSDPRLAVPAADDLDGWLGMLADDPGRPDALERLEALEESYRRGREGEKLVELYVGRTALEPDAVRRATLLGEAARILDEELGDPGRALAAALEAYRDRPIREAWEDLERLAGQAEGWQQLAAALTSLVPSVDPADRADAWARIAAIRDEELGDPEGALEAVSAALALDPAHRDAATRRLELLRRTHRWEELAAVLDPLAEAEASRARRAELLTALGDVFETHLNDAVRAEAAYRRALQADPDAVEVRAALESLLLRRGEVGELVRLLEERAELAPPAERPALRRRLAELCEERLADPRAAIRHWEAVRALVPGDLVSLRALLRLYEQEGRMRSFLEVLAQAAESAESERDRVELLRRLGREWERIPGGAQRALQCFETLLSLDPSAEDVLETLERLYRADRRTGELVAVLERQLAVAPPGARVALHLRVGRLCEQELGDAERARAAFEAALAIEPGNGAVLEELAHACELAGDHERAVALYERRAAGAPEAAQVALLARAGAIAGERLGDPVRAEALFVRALEGAPFHVPSLVGLAGLYRRRGELLKAARLLTEAATHAQNRLQRARLLVEAGESYERIDDPGRALSLYRQALEEDPEHVDAAERAGDLLWRAGRRAEVVPLYEMLVRKEAPPEVCLARLVRLGLAAQADGDAERAERAFTRARELDLFELEVLRGLGAIYFESGRLAEAREMLVALLAEHQGRLATDEQVEVHHRIGRCELAAGQVAAAREQFALACALDPTHRPSRLGQLELGDQDPAAVIESKKALLHTAPKGERLALHIEIGDLYLDRLEDPVLAAGAWEAGLAIQGDDVRLLHRLLNVFVEQKAWAQALDTLDKLIRGEPKGSARSKYHYTAGTICREHLGRFADAVDHLWAAVEGDPSHQRAVAALEEMLRNHKSWKELVRYYQLALKRLEPVTRPEQRVEQLRLWTALGEVYLDRLRDPESAVVSFEVALRLDPTLRRRQQLATIYTVVGRLDQAIQQHQLMLREDKTRIASYRALKELYADAERPDHSEAWARALACLGADGSQLPTLADEELGAPARPLSSQQWIRLRHPDEDPELSALFAAVAPAVLAARAQREGQPLVRKRLLAPEDPRRFARILRHASAALGVPVPAAYVVGDQVDAFSLSCAIDGQVVTPVLLIGRPILDEARASRDLVFEIGRALGRLHPEHFIRWLLPQPSALAHLMQAAIALAEEASGKETAGELAKTTQAYRQNLSAPTLDAVVALGHRLKTREIALELAALRWMRSSDLSVARIGLVLAGDVARCARLIKQEPASPTVWPAPQRVLDLVWSSATDDLVEARSHLGLA